MDYKDNKYGKNAVDDMMTYYDYHINTGELPELLDNSSVDDFSPTSMIGISTNKLWKI